MIFTYFKLELKKMYSCIPMILLGMLLFGAIIGTAVFSANTISHLVNKEEEPITVGLIQKEEDRYTTIFITAIEELDVIKNTIRFERLSEDDAMDKLSKGKLYVVFKFPDDFAQNIYYGEEDQIEIIIDKQTTSLYSYMVKPISEIATNYIVQSERSIYALSDYYKTNDLEGRKDANRELNFDYFKILLNRMSVFANQELSNTYYINNIYYYFCIGFIILIFMSMLTFSKALSNEDISFYKRINAGGLSPQWQVISKYAACVITAMIPYIITVITVFTVSHVKSIGVEFSAKSLLLLFPVILPAVALAQLLYELSKNPAAAQLSFFFIFVVCAYISGIFYPESYLPDVFNKISEFTFTKAVLNYALNIFAGESILKSFILILLHSCIFIILTIIIRIRRLKKN